MHIASELDFEAIVLLIMSSYHVSYHNNDRIIYVDKSAFDISVSILGQLIKSLLCLGKYPMTLPWHRGWPQGQRLGWRWEYD